MDLSICANNNSVPVTNMLANPYTVVSCFVRELLEGWISAKIEPCSSFTLMHLFSVILHKRDFTYFVENFGLTIRECGYVGLTGTFWKLIQKSMGIDMSLLSISPHLLGMSKASDNTKAAMNKQKRLIHSGFSHVGP